jgi:hypothetical protein
MAAALAIELTAMCTQPAVERATLHTAMRTSSKCSAAAERASARLASSASCRVTRRVSRSVSREGSWQFTPETSSIQPIHHSPSCWTIAVYSLLYRILPSGQNTPRMVVFLVEASH